MSRAVIKDMGMLSFIVGYKLVKIWMINKFA